MLRAVDLTHSYDGRVVLTIDRLDLEPGTVTALVGPNGSGKSTLLRLLSFLERPTSGTLLLGGEPVMTERQRRAARRRVTLVEQHPLLFDTTVARNLSRAFRWRGLPGDERRTRVASALERAGLTHLMHRQARELSGGETQRVAIARALALSPDVLLLDEPLSAADRSAVDDLERALAEARAAGAAVCLSSHQLEAAYRVATQPLTLAGGHLHPSTPENMFRVTIPPGDGARPVRAGPLEILVVTDRAGPATLLIPPEDIVVSTERVHTSARNQYRGRIVGVTNDHHGRIAVTVDVGIPLITRITPGAFTELGLALGVDVVVSFKAMAVRVF